MKGIYLAASGMMGQWMKLEAISNNISNINTAAYKKDTIHFRNLLMGGVQPQTRPGVQLASIQNSSSPSLSPLQSYYPVGNYAIDFSEGELHETGNPLDLALKGEGFFVVSTPQGRRYTRSGGFTLSTNGELQTLDGFPVLSKNGPIPMPRNGGEVEVTSSGEVKVDGKVVGALDIVDVSTPSALVKDGKNLFYSPSGQSQELSANAEVLQGYLEQSNVNPVNQMVELINTVRSFQMYQKAMQTFDDNFGRLLDIAGRS